MNHYQKLWVEKYRPKTIDQIVLDDDIKNELKNISGDIPHILFHGSAGIGKTSTAKVLINDVLKCQYLYINASDENGIDTIRTKVMNFAKTRSIDGSKKVILLDEMDAMTGAAMSILRNVMEEFSETCRFILTANYYSKIIEPIRSRCVIFDLKPDIKGCIKRCLEILNAENVQIPNKSTLIDDLKTFVDQRFPDLRRIINDLQKFCSSGTLNFKNSDFVEKFSNKLYNLLKSTKNINEIRKFVINNENSVFFDYQKVYKDIFNIILNDSSLEEIKKKHILLEIGEYAFRDNTVVDHEINFFCFILSISNILEY